MSLIPVPIVIPKPVCDFVDEYVRAQNARISNKQAELAQLLIKRNEAQRRANIAQEEYEAMQKEIEAHKTNVVVIQSFVSKVGEVFI